MNPDSTAAFMAIFIGSCAKETAIEYARWKEGLIAGVLAQCS